MLFAPFSNGHEKSGRLFSWPPPVQQLEKSDICQRDNNKKVYIFGNLKLTYF